MREYQQEFFAQKTPYLQWLREQETELGRQYGQQLNQGAPGKQMYTLPFSSCMDRVPGAEDFRAGALYLFVKDGGSLSDYAVAVFENVLADNPDAVLAYADEDYRGSLWELYGIADGIFKDAVTSSCRFGEDGAHYRGAPWFKPDYSPDTLASFFYIGSVFAIRGDAISEMLGTYGSEISIYELVYRIFMDVLARGQQGRYEGIVHIPKVLYTNNSLADAERIDTSERIAVLYKTEDRAQDRTDDKVSIVIPSKDNAEILQKCLETLTKYTDYRSYKIIVVDNGSNSEQRRRITDVIDALERKNTDLAIRYLYQERTFNFSAMCNAGARFADGGYLLFLNDDIEVIGTDEGRRWLDRMLVYARKTHVGAVGAKLYYPCGSEDSGCSRIQHAGITNMGIGPAHKLGGMVDEGCLYHGHNTYNYDMLAVTAACMLVRKCVFDEVGGFDETFPVAYNDVEFCFRLHQRGYFIVQVNEAVLIHHESVSRGQDTSPEKLERLSQEKKRLYQKYPLLNARDPFYSPNLVQWKKDVEYHTGYLYDFDRQVNPVLLGNDGENGKRKRAVFKLYDIRELLHGRCRLAAKVYDWLTGYHDLFFHVDSVCYDNSITDDNTADSNLTVEGWFAVKNADNADVPRKLWLIYETRTFPFRRVYEFDAAPKLREDVAALLEENGRNGTKNTALSGIQVNIGQSVLMPGTYSVGVLCRNRLVCDPETRVEIPNRCSNGDSITREAEDKERKV